MVDAAKHQEQMKILAAWAKAGFKATAIAPTGVGKSRVIAIAAGEHIRRQPTEKWLVVVPTEHIRDVEIPENFMKWGYGNEGNMITVECIQSSYHRTKEHWNGLVVDEVHRLLTPEYSKLLENNTFDKILCLSATIPRDKEEMLDQYGIPVVYRLSVEEALSKGLISSYRIFNLPVKFTVEEKKKYDVIQQNYTYYEKILGGQHKAFKTAGEFRLLNLHTFDYVAAYAKDSMDCKTIQEFKLKIAEMKDASFRFYRLMGSRKQLCFNAVNKAVMTKAIVDKFPDRRGIYFSESIKSAEDVCSLIGGEISVSFHSKMSDKVRAENMLAFSDKGGKIKFLCAARAVNEGVNVPDCSLGICGSGPSTALHDIQRRGRTTRVDENDPDKVAYYFNLYVEGTQEQKWVRQRTRQDPNVEWITELDDIIE